MTNSYSYESDTAYAQRRAQPPLDNSPMGLVGRGLELLGRPLSGVTTGIQFGLQNKNPLEGFMQGITGQSQTRGLANLLEAQGVGEGPSIGPINARGVAGFVGDVALDPITALTLPFGGGPSVLGRGIRAASPGLGRAIEATPVVRGLAGMEAPARATEGLIEPTLTRGYEQTGLRTLAGLAGRVPGIEGIINAINPSALQNEPVQRALGQFGRAIEADKNNAIPAALSRIAALERKAGFAYDDHNRWLLQDGSYRHFADLALEDDGVVRNLLTPQQFAAYRQAKDVWRESMDMARGVGVDLGSLGQRTDIELLPRAYMKKEIDASGRPKFRPVLPEQGVQMQRLYDKVDDAIGGGFEPLNLMSTMRQKLTEIYGATRAKQLADVMDQAGIGARFNRSEMESLRGASMTAQQARMAATSLKQRVADMQRGLVPGAAEIRRLSEAFPEIADSLQAAASVSIPSFTQSLGRFAREVQDLTGVSGNRLLQAIKDVQIERAGAQPLTTPMKTGLRIVDMRTALNRLGKEDDTTVNLLERIYRNAYDASAGQRQDILNSLSQTADDLLAQRRTTAQEARQAYGGFNRSENDRLAGQLGIEPSEMGGIPGSAAFKDMKFDASDKAAIVSYFQRSVPGFLEKASDASGLVRGIQATGDLSAGFIQGLLLLATRPREWGGMWANGLRALVDPAAYDRYLARPDNQELLRKLPTLMIGKTELTEAFGPGSVLERTPGLNRAKGLFAPFNRAFDAMGDTARIEWARALLPNAEAAGANLDELASFINKATGTMSTAALGVSPAQRALESSLLFYSPRMTRAALAIVGDAMRGGMRGERSRESLAHLAVGGTAFFMKAARMAGLSDEDIQDRLDPTQGHFMTVPIAGQNIGVGGPFMAIAKLLARSADNPENLIPGSEDNPLVAFWRGRTAPLLRTGWDVMSGETAIGEPVNNLESFAKNEVASQVFPFAWQGMAEVAMSGGDATGMAANVGAQFLGGKASPEGYADMRNELARKQFGVRYDQLTPEEQVQIENLPELKNMPLPQGKRYEQARMAQTISGGFANQVQQLALAVQDNRISKEDFRQKVTDLTIARNAQYEMLAPREEQEGLSEREEMRRQYLAIFSQKDENGNVPYDRAEEFLAGLPPDVQTWIEQKQMAGMDRLPPEAAALMKELTEARRTLKPYREIPDEVMAKLGILDRYRGMNPKEQEAFTETALYKRAQKLWKAYQERYRFRNPEADTALVTWYGNKPIRQQQRSLAVGGIGSVSGVKGL